jgi:hypothetical protein
VDDRSQPYRRDVQLRSLYGITQADYDRLLALQYGRCAICGTTKPGTRGTWRVDHDHETGQVRGLLCDRCNLGIGYMQDDPDILIAAARYVMKGRQKKSWPGRPSTGEAVLVGHGLWRRDRSEIVTDQNKAALRSLHELAEAPSDSPVRLHFGPFAPDDAEAAGRWIKTVPGKGWFVFFRIYGPEAPAFDGTWQLPDFEPAP